MDGNCEDGESTFAWSPSEKGPPAERVPVNGGTKTTPEQRRETSAAGLARVKGLYE